MSSSTMSEVIKAAILWGHTLPGLIGRFRAIPSVEDDILPNLTFALHPDHGSAPEEYQCLLDGLKHALFMYLLTTGHLDPKWNNAVAYPPSVHIMEWTSLRYEMLYATAFPHRNPGSSSKIHFFCRVWSERLPENVAQLMFLPAKSNQVSGCIINIDYELSEALEAMAYMDMDTFLHELELSGLVESLGEEYDLCHDWIHAELLTAISDSAEGLLDGDLLDEAGIQLE
ncbi:hypothetical protein F5146DRAFT_1003992 [Armillaria mellea]|nr:hypothetical protein F5146DRAFT_1003992 [Armillaria mellea]